jgi:hypothetical protein
MVMPNLDAEILFTLVVVSLIALGFGFSTVIEASCASAASMDGRG